MLQCVVLLFVFGYEVCISLCVKLNLLLKFGCYRSEFI